MRRLLRDGRLVVIDFGQAVDASHPSSTDFLAADARHVTDFFARRGAVTLPPDALASLVADSTLMPHPPAGGGGERTGSRGGHVPRAGSGAVWRGAARGGGDGVDGGNRGGDDDAPSTGAAWESTPVDPPCAHASARSVESVGVDWFDGRAGPVAAALRQQLLAAANFE